MAFEPLPLNQFAQIARVGVKEVQLYQDYGLLQPPRRRRGRSGAIAFHQEHFDRLHFIKRALAYGFSLELIGEFLSTDRMRTCKDIRQLTLGQVDKLRRNRGPADPMVMALEKLIATCDGRGGRRDCQILINLAQQDE